MRSSNSREEASRFSDSELYDMARRRPGGPNMERAPFLPRPPRDEPTQIEGGGMNVEGEGGGAQITGQGDGDIESGERGGQSAETLQIDGRDEPRQIPEGPRYLWRMYVWATLVTLIYFVYHWAAFKLDSKGKVVGNGSWADYIILVIIADVIVAAFLVYVLNYLMTQLLGHTHLLWTTHPAPRRLNIMIKILIQTISNLGISAYLEMNGKSERRYDIIYFGLALSSFFTSLVCYIYQEGYAEVISMLSFLFNGLLIYVIAERAWWWLMLVIPLNCMAAAFNAWLLWPSSPPVSTPPS